MVGSAAFFLGPRPLLEGTQHRLREIIPTADLAIEMTRIIPQTIADNSQRRQNIKFHIAAGVQPVVRLGHDHQVRRCLIEHAVTDGFAELVFHFARHGFWLRAIIINL